MAPPQPIPSPNAWYWPQLYDRENSCQDEAGAIWQRLRERVDWRGRTVLDLGCGTGFQLPMLAAQAAEVIGVEPYVPLLERARRRAEQHAVHQPSARIRVLEGQAEAIPVPGASVDVVHARTAYFFGPGCEAGLAEVERVLRPGGVLAVIDLDLRAEPYGRWLRAQQPRLTPDGVERFFRLRGFTSEAITTRWRFDSRSELRRVLGIEFPPGIADAALAEVSGSSLSVGYRLRLRRTETGLR